MGNPTGFLEYVRHDPPKRPVDERVRDYREVEVMHPDSELRRQAARCMDCGVPFCHAIGCPLGNIIPEWNDLLYRGRWCAALDLLHATNNFPEVTGRICPAPCEPACTLSVNADPVTIRHIELQIAERGWKEGWIRPEPASERSGRRVAVVGSGPAGLAAAQQLARCGHDVVVFEKADRIGGILRYGIPDFKLDKRIIDRRLEQMRAEHVVFEPAVTVGADISCRYMLRKFDALFLAMGARVPRELDVPGAGLDGIHFAMPFLVQQNRVNAGDAIPLDERIDAAGKHVVVVGGGDTGADCVGTCRRQGAAFVTQIELLPQPPTQRPAGNPWPDWPVILRTSSSHEEGCERLWSILCKEAVGEGGHARGLKCVRIEWGPPEQGRRAFQEVPDSDFELKADMVLLAMGFVHVEGGPLVHELGLELDGRGNIAVDADHMTSRRGVFAAGDCVTGASLVVRAIAVGREVAASLHRFLS